MKNFGFGCMRLPMKDGEVDAGQFARMVDEFLAAGFTYFDTAHGYLDEKSETAIRDGLVRRHPREAFQLADKLTAQYFKKEEEIRPFVLKQLKLTGVDYFDVYLLHAVTADSYEKFTRCNAFAVLEKLRAEGKIRRLAISFHDKADLLDRVLTEHPEIEAVQIQFNYADYDDPTIQSGAVCDVCRRHGKPVIVMEPCKGGGLTDLPEEAKAVLAPLGGTPASYAIRFAASQPGVALVLSGMSDLDQLRENIAFMQDFRPLDDRERAAVDRVRVLLRGLDTIPCTGCSYCTAGCPKRIPIPELFACYNKKQRYKDWNSNYYYGIAVRDKGKASDCIACGRCEKTCPQHLSIRALLQEVADALEPKQGEQEGERE